MAELGDLTPPVVGAATGLHGHRTGRQRCQEREKLAAAQLLAKDNRARAVSPMELKDVFGEIEADGANLVHGRLLEWALTPPLWHAEAVGGVHTIRPVRPVTQAKDVSHPDKTQLVLQLPFSLTVVVSGCRFGLVLSPPDGPGHDKAGSDWGPEQETG